MSERSSMKEAISQHVHRDAGWGSDHDNYLIAGRIVLSRLLKFGL